MWCASPNDSPATLLLFLLFWLRSCKKMLLLSSSPCVWKICAISCELLLWRTLNVMLPFNNASISIKFISFTRWWIEFGSSKFSDNCAQWAKRIYQQIFWWLQFFNRGSILGLKSKHAHLSMVLSLWFWWLLTIYLYYFHVLETNWFS